MTFASISQRLPRKHDKYTLSLIDYHLSNYSSSSSGSSDHILIKLTVMLCTVLWWSILNMLHWLLWHLYVAYLNVNNMKRWLCRNRMPLISDDLSHWSDIFHWRQHHYQAIVSAYEALAPASADPQVCSVWLLTCSDMMNLVKLCISTTNLPSVLWHRWLGGRKGIQPLKNWVVRCWRGYLSAARCSWFSYGPADGTASPVNLLLQ